MFVGTFIVALAWAWLRGGRLRAAEGVQIRWVWAIFGAFLLPVLVQRVHDFGVPLQAISPYLYVLSLLVLLAALWLNRRLAGVPLIGAGVLLNFIVIAANGGRMPVSVDVLKRYGADQALALLQSGDALTHVGVAAHTRLVFLADIFPLPIPRLSLISIGDILLCAGLFWAVQSVMGRWQRRAGDNPAVS